MTGWSSKKTEILWLSGVYFIIYSLTLSEKYEGIFIFRLGISAVFLFSAFETRFWNAHRSLFDMAGPFFTQQYTDLRVIVKSASYNLNNHIEDFGL